MAATSCAQGRRDGVHTFLLLPPRPSSPASKGAGGGQKKGWQAGKEGGNV